MDIAAVADALAGFAAGWRNSGIDKVPGALVTHAHGASGGGDGTEVLDGFEPLYLVGAECNPFAKDKAGKLRRRVMARC